MADLSHRVLEALAKTTAPVSSLTLASDLNEDHQRIVGAIKSLQGLGEVDENGVRKTLIEVGQELKTDWVLKEEGHEIAKHGSHEFRVLRLVTAGKGKEEIEVGDYIRF